MLSLLILTLMGKEHYLNTITTKTNTLCILVLAMVGEELSMHARIKSFNVIFPSNTLVTF